MTRSSLTPPATRVAALVAALVLCAAAVAFAPFLAGPALAQGGPRALVVPGDRVQAPLAESEGGPAGRELARALGKRPVIGLYWRPGEPLSEQALVNAAALVPSVAPDAIFFPLAYLAAGQPPASIGERLAALGLNLPPREDGGQLARVLGVTAIPSFFLIDAAGVLRQVGGSDITQASSSGTSIAEALAIAGKGQPVPTLGVMPSDPIFRMLGQRLPDVAGTELDGATWRKLSDYVGKGKRVLLFYWSPQCPHCRQELPRLSAWAQAGKPDDVTLLGVARADAANLRTEAATIVRGLPGTHLLDVDRSISRGLMVREFPSTYLIAADGEILAIRTGGHLDWNGWIKGVAAGRAARSN